MPPRSRNDAGVTLVECAIVLLVIATVSLFAVPTFQSSQIRGNEAEARRILREIADAQRRFHERNRGATYGLLPELMGRALRPGVDAGARLLDEGGVVRDLTLHTRGYLFSVHLPRAVRSGGRRSGSGPAPAETGPGDAFVAYAWPVNAGYSGRLVYVIDDTGALRQWANDRDRWFQGEHRPPPPDLAPHPRGAFGEPPLRYRTAIWEPAADP